MAKVLSKQERMGFLQQADWSTPQSAGANFRTIQWIDSGSTIPEPDVQVDQFNSQGAYGIHKESERFFVDKISGLPTIPFSGLCDKSTIAGFLVAAFQAVSEAAGTPFEKTITAGGLTGPIDFNGGSGYLFTIALDQAASADDGVILENAIIQNLNLNWDLNARGIARLVSMSGSWVGNELNYEQTLNGTWTNATQTQDGLFNNTDTWTVKHGSLLLTIGGVDYSAECIRRVELQINNNVVSNCKTSGGKANQYDISPEYKLMVHLNYNSVTEKLLKDFQDDVDATMNWSNDSLDAGADGAWSFVFPTLKIVSQPKEVFGDFLGIALELELQSAAGATPLTCYLSDAFDWTF